MIMQQIDKLILMQKRFNMMCGGVLLYVVYSNYQQNKMFAELIKSINVKNEEFNEKLDLLLAAISALSERIRLLKEITPEAITPPAASSAASGAGGAGADQVAAAAGAASSMGSLYEYLPIIIVGGVVLLAFYTWGPSIPYYYLITGSIGSTANKSGSVDSTVGANISKLNSADNPIISDIIKGLLEEGQLQGLSDSQIEQIINSSLSLEELARISEVISNIPS